MNFKDKLIEKFNKYNIAISNKQCEMLELFHQKLIKYNQTHNLTRIVDDNDAIIKHYLDSILPINIFKKNSKAIDIGCGGGFPSIPIKILRNDINLTAIDSVNKKINFVNIIKNDLNLPNFEALHARIEDFAHNSQYRENFDYAVSRAVAPLNTIIEYSAPFLKNNGYIISYKGTNYEEETKNAENALKKLNCIVEKIEKYYIEELDTYRYVIIIKKVNTIDKTYPRKGNKPRTQPL